MERDRRSKSPVSLQPPPRGANKIYTYDVVFRIGEANTNNHSKTQFPYNAPARKKRPKDPAADRHFFRGTFLDFGADSVRCFDDFDGFDGFDADAFDAFDDCIGGLPASSSCKYRCPSSVQ